MVGMIRSGSLALFLLCTLCAGICGAQTLQEMSGPWVMERSGTAASLRGVHSVGGGVAWASGTAGTVLRTEDGGYEWQSCAIPPGAEKLDFRGIWAFDDTTAVVMSSGPGSQSRIYRTTDGCAHWKLTFTNPDQDGFWDAVAFRNNQDGEILGDPLPGAGFATFCTSDGGVHWKRCMSAALKSDPKRSGAFAASNTSLVLRDGRGWIGIGGRDGSFVYRGVSAASNPQRLHWTKVAVPISGGKDSSGVFSVAFRDAGHGVAVGGNYTQPSASTGTAAWTSDGGRSWAAATQPPHGYRSAVAWDPEAGGWIAAGTNGSDISYDGGRTWQALDGAGTGGDWNALSLPWVVGPKGRIAKLDPGRVPHRGQ